MEQRKENLAQGKMEKRAVRIPPRKKKEVRAVTEGLQRCFRVAFVGLDSSRIGEMKAETRCDPGPATWHDEAVDWGGDTREGLRDVEHEFTFGHGLWNTSRGETSRQTAAWTQRKFDYWRYVRE